MKIKKFCNRFDFPEAGRPPLIDPSRRLEHRTFFVVSIGHHPVKGRLSSQICSYDGELLRVSTAYPGRVWRLLDELKFPVCNELTSSKGEVLWEFTGVKMEEKLKDCNPGLMRLFCRFPKYRSPLEPLGEGDENIV